MNHYIIPAPIGKIGMTLQNGTLTHIGFVPASCKFKLPKDDDAAQHIIAELKSYFKNPQHHFSINFLCQGTVFQKRVWKALQAIPCGKTVTYGMLAKQLKTHPRAIGQACKKNPITIIIPCHRVIAANHLGGYAGKTAGTLWDVKEWLLKHEAAGNSIDEIHNQSGRSKFSRCRNSRW